MGDSLFPKWFGQGLKALNGVSSVLCLIAFPTNYCSGGSNNILFATLRGRDKKRFASKTFATIKKNFHGNLIP